MSEPIKLDSFVSRSKYSEYYQRVEKVLPLELRRTYRNLNVVRTETWVRVTPRGYVSSHGRVMRKQKDGTEKILSPCNYAENEAELYLLDGEKHRINSLVAGAFNAVGVGNYVLHINRDNNDNRIDNLKRVSNGRTSLYDGLPSRFKTEKEPILEYDLYGNFVRRWETAARAEETNGYRKGDILLCAEGIGYTAENRIWAFENAAVYGGKALSVEERVKAIAPCLIKGYRDGREYVFVTVDKAVSYTGIQKYLLFALLLTGREYEGWRFDYNGEKYKEGEYTWNFCNAENTESTK